MPPTPSLLLIDASPNPYPHTSTVFAFSRKDPDMSRTKLVAAAMAGTLAFTTAAPAQPALAETPAASSSSSEVGEDIGTAIGVIALLIILGGLYGWFSPYNPNGAWANQ